MNKDKLIKRDYSFEIRVEENENNESVIVGRPIVYGSRTDICGWFEEVIEPGALKDTNLDDVRFLVNHDTSKVPLARCRKGDKSSTMQLSLDNDGMGIRVSLDVENNSEARNLYSAIKRGDISGMSFMFSIDKETWDNVDSDYPTRHIEAISEVVEVSAVTFPAYEETSIATRAKDALERARDSMDKVKDESKALELEKLKLKYLFKI